MIERRVVIALGSSQLISWGVTYYLIGGFGEQISADLGWSRDIVYSGFAIALLVMGVTSPIVGHIIDRRGGRYAMSAGAVANAAGCCGLAVCHVLPMYFVSWIILGLGMRLTLYDAAFAALVRIAGPQARQAMSQITLLGGLSASVFWPFGHLLSEAFGWRIALLVYASLAIFTVLLCLAIPNRRYDGASTVQLLSDQPNVNTRRKITIAAGLYTIITTVANFLNAGMSAHMIAILSGLGLGASLAVWIATLRGVGQSAARLCEVVFGARISPLTLNLAACVVMPFSFVVGLFSGASGALGIAFCLTYGACNGILTITRGTLPLVLFDHHSYGALVGRLIIPSFILPAAAPLVYAIVIDHIGNIGALWMSIVFAAVMLVAAILLTFLFGRPRGRKGRHGTRSPETS